MDKDLIYIRAVQIGMPDELFQEYNIRAVKKWGDMISNIIAKLRDELVVSVAIHVGGGCVYVLCKDDHDNLKAFDFLDDRLPDVHLCKRFPRISRAQYEDVWGTYRG